MRPFVRLGALLAAPLLVALVAAPAAAQEDPVSEQVDYAVTASFDKAEYGSGDDFVVTITVSNVGEVPITTVSVFVDTLDLNFGDQTWGPLEAPGTALAPGEQVTATATARLSAMADTAWLTVNVILGLDQWDPDDENVDAAIEAPVHPETGIVEGLVYGDRDADGTPDAGEELRGIKIGFTGGVPFGDYEARTGSDGRYRVELPTGRYSVYGPPIDGWLFEENHDVPVRPGEQQLDVGARRVGQPVIRAAMSFDRNQYAVGDPIRVHVTLTNPSATAVSGIVAWCSRADNSNEVPRQGWGELEFGGPGAVVPAHATREFDVLLRVPAGALDYGYVSASCGFIVGDDTYNSAEASAIADVPGGFVDYGGKVLQVRADGRKVPAAHVRLVLVHRSGRVAARTTSDAKGRYVFRHAPTNQYRMRVGGAWKLVDPDHAYYVTTIGIFPPEDVLIVRGPAPPGAGGGARGGTGAPPADTAPPVDTGATAGTPGTLAGTGADVGTPFLAGLLLLATGAVLVSVRPRRTPVRTPR
jgi:hypothetical protein